MKHVLVLLGLLTGSPAALAQDNTVPADADAGLAARVASVEGKTDALEKAVSDEAVLLDRITRLKIAGFVQGRYEWHQDSVNGWDYKSNSAASSTRSTFYVRRARLDLNYLGTNAEFVLQLDAGGDTVGLRDAEAAFLDTWTPLHLRVSLGQFKVPFGYELQQGDPIREMPERSRMILQLFPGERDRGLKVQGRYRALRFQLALVNGNGIQDPIFKAGKDSNAWLDFVGRVGVDFDVIAAGASWYVSGSDVYNPSSTTDTTVANLKRYGRVRVGGDVQGNIDVPRLGNLALRGEIIYSRDTNKDYGGQVADLCQDRTGLGFSLIAAQNLGRFLGAVVRVDSYDPVLRSTLASTCAITEPGTYALAGMDRVITYGGGLLIYVSANLKATFVYEHPSEQPGRAIDNDIVTAQLQARF